jgi:formylglycine-generating enzyme required for sulfatase activity
VRGLLLSLLLLQAHASCVVSEKCFRGQDCKAGETCSAEGRCVAVQLDIGPLPDGKPPVRCSSDMVTIAEAFCMDIYEASRPDATPSLAGVDGSRATSRPGILPWQVQSNAEAEQACKAAGKRLCTSAEWEMACKGPKKTAYAYGESYQPTTCNGIDAFSEGEFHLAPTGSFPGCKNEWGVFDMNGNVWEHIAGGSEKTLRGGAYNCSDSKTLHRCDYIPGSWAPTARGFRCCAEGSPVTSDGGTRDVGVSDKGCLTSPDGKLDQATRDVPVDLRLWDRASIDLGPDLLAPKDGSTSGCPLPGMVPVGGQSCIDIFEASRPDATASSVGSDSSKATSRKGVLPWQVQSNLEADAACTAAGKRLCTPAEWQTACQGPLKTVYAYGDTYNGVTCNGIDTFSGLQFHLMPTGSFPGCTNAWGVFDMNGNLWEHVAGGNGMTIRGGAYNCGDSMTYHRCDYVPSTWSPTAQGFRCCASKPPPVG